MSRFHPKGAEASGARSSALGRFAGALVLCAVMLGVASMVLAQRRRRTPPPPPPIAMDSAVVSWSLFVSAYGDTGPSRRAIPDEHPGPIPVPLEGWSCIYSATTRARLNDSAWSEVRHIECIRGEAVVSTSGFCEVIGGAWGARAGVLRLGTTAGSEHLDITLDCEVH